ncbi:MAG: divalent-cation tolerance protein CutA [Hyphomicrobiales bacterium]|jgi:periplasmic divalent cation tolerance protein|nr:divalent-cation tolerance protein CutA [Hyphomicrobiales bacterium]
MSELIDVWVNCANEDEAAIIAEAAVKSRLAACSNICAPIVSSYHWKGGIENDHEVPLLLKTRSGLFDELAGLVEALHSYETPGIVGIAADHVNAAYMQWILAETKQAID